MFDNIEILKTIPIVEPVYAYQKEAVEHLVDQIIKIHNANQREYAHSLIETMEILNQSLKCALMPNLVLKLDK